MNLGAEISIARRSFGPDLFVPSAAAFIAAFESCRLKAYQDSRGVWTIGWGHTGSEVLEGTAWSQQQADTVFAAEVAAAGANAKELLAEPTPGQLVALSSLIYNVGFAGVRASMLPSLLRSSDWIGAARDIVTFDHQGHCEVAGLLHRRLAEALVFVAGSPGA